ncbi:MAG: hypothetical protein WDM79_13745 [Terricaulis sp.]
MAFAPRPIHDTIAPFASGKRPVGKEANDMNNALLNAARAGGAIFGGMGD